ncbi:hypothetical protein [Methylocystis heyeri]|uniref:AAA domain-containing protein n=1 Tax=Methylocystis heyeri TaxID=391905 RepID=A0A6B8KEV3_9HYPH|nr:hypothetical protein [Methylocystis heyeri]QGM46152.1 hypothetical protein H2LOC_010840 [Methylocystis heyeri]
MTLTLKQIASRIPGYYKAGLSIHLEGPPGGGKTSIMETVPQLLAPHYAPECEFGIITLNGAGTSETDATGYLIPTPGKDGAKPSSEFTEPYWMRTKDGRHMRDFSGGILFIDEADKLPLDAKKILGEAALSRRFASHTLSDGWLVWSAGNRAEDRSGATKELDHLINRRMRIRVGMDLESWVEWAHRHDMSPESIRFAEENAGMMFEGSVPKVQGPWLTPRSMELGDNYLRTIAGDGPLPMDPVAQTEISGLIGEAAAMQFIAMVKIGIELPSIDEIVADPGSTRIPKKADAQMLLVYKLANYFTPERAGSVITYMKRKEFAQEFAVSFFKMACARHPRTILLPEVVNWTRSNAQLVTIASSFRG